ncbi:MAG: glycosyltransferase, partial [Aquiluna sp.]
MAGALRVVIPCDTFAPDINGAARFAERLAGGLVRRGHEVHIIAPAFDSSEGPRIEHHDGVNMIVHRLRSHRVPQHRTLRWPEPWGMTKKIFGVLKEVEPHAVHIQSHLMVGRFALRAAKKLNLRTLATNHVMPENLMRYSLLPKFLHKFAMRVIWADAGRILRKMDALTTPTKRAAELLEEAAGVTDVLAISCGIDASRFANQTPTQNANPVALFLGRLDDEKKIDVFLRAVAQLTDFPNLRVELVGDGGERERLQKLAESLKIASRVSFLGHVTDDELPGIYERATVFVMPSIAELQSIATMEAMASGRPVIAADAMALPHLVHDGDNGYLFPPGDVEALAERLRRVLAADQKELSRLSENSLHLIQSHDIQRTRGIFEDLYRGVGEPAPTT